jgi:hypothetical protein
LIRLAQSLDEDNKGWDDDDTDDRSRDHATQDHDAQALTSVGGAGPAGLVQLRLYAYQLAIDRGKKAKPDVKPSELGNGKAGRRFTDSAPIAPHGPAAIASRLRTPDAAT